MREMRTYKPVCNEDGIRRQKTVYWLDKDDIEHLKPMWDAGNIYDFVYECRNALDAYDIPSRWDGDWFERFRFELTPCNRLSVERIWGYDI